MELRAPSLPIIAIDPYFSVWTENSPLENTVHWTGKPNSIKGRVFIDQTEYHFLGYNNAPVLGETQVPNMEIISTEADAFSTIFKYKAEGIILTVHFTSPTLVDDLYYASRPVSYCKVSYESADDRKHEVRVKFSVSEELVLNEKGEGGVYAQSVEIENLSAIRMGKEQQNVLEKCGDDIRIDWGFFYIAAKGEAKTGNEVFGNMYAVYAEKELNNEALFLFAYDDIYSIVYFGEQLKAYWCNDGKTITQAILEAANEYDALLLRCNAFSKKLEKAAIEKGSEKYCELLLLAYRQVMAGHKLVVDKKGNNLYISKECFSNGCAATVDVTYPSAPLYLLYNTELLKGMMRPIMEYAAGTEWTCDFAPHDVGTYPHVNGQVYSVERTAAGVEIKPEGQMPVEECGNMIILFAAIMMVEDDASFAEKYITTIAQWSEYLIKYGLDPENQLCTDDFAGHLPHNVNLSIKAIMGIAGYAKILQKLGKNNQADEAMEIAKQYALSLMEQSQNSDNSHRLAYDKPETFSLKYNAIWDKIWKTNLFPDEFFKYEIERYKKELLPYGVPLDSREKYTKSDWLVWASSFAENEKDFRLLTDSLWSAYNTMTTRVPMTDWYFCDTSEMRGFRHRTVQGGLFIKLMLD